MTSSIPVSYITYSVTLSSFISYIHNLYILVRILRFGETMNFGLEKQLDRIVETLALSALLQANPIAGTNKLDMEKKLIKRLRQIAFPLEEMEEISEDSDLTALFESAVE